MKEALVGALQPAYRMLLTKHLEQMRRLRKQVEEPGSKGHGFEYHLLAIALTQQVDGVIGADEIELNGNELLEFEQVAALQSA